MLLAEQQNATFLKSHGQIPEVGAEKEMHFFIHIRRKIWCFGQMR